MCPEDPARARASSGPDAGRFVPRIRSYSMNNWIGGSAWLTTGWTVYTNLAQVTLAGADRLWVLMDEHPDSINDGFFVVDMTGYPTSPGQTRIVDFPTYYHGRGAAVGFADGRAEVRVWKDNRTVPPSSLSFNVAQPNNPDIIWLQERSTRRSN
jgi:prepilin-type processing-associated H-X9-DG protein